MAYVGYTGVANLANTTDGFANGVGAQNVPSLTNDFGMDVGDGGVVDLYHPVAPPPPTPYFILMENSGYVLQQDNVSKIQLQ